MGSMSNKNNFFSYNNCRIKFNFTALYIFYLSKYTMTFLKSLQIIECSFLNLTATIIKFIKEIYLNKFEDNLDHENDILIFLSVS